MLIMVVVDLQIYNEIFEANNTYSNAVCIFLCAHTYTRGIRVMGELTFVTPSFSYHAMRMFLNILDALGNLVFR